MGVLTLPGHLSSSLVLKRHTMVKRRTDNTMAKRRRTDNTMVKRRTDNTMVKRRTDNTMDEDTKSNICL
jgi:hypothetical protein